jgi:hypothetical protein
MLKRFLSACRTATIAHQAAALILGDTVMDGAASVYGPGAGATLPDAPSSVGRCCNEVVDQLADGNGEGEAD